jgi:hypothetical protein
MGFSQFSDALYMHQLAGSLAAGEGFTINGQRIFNQSVGYPAFIAVFYAFFGVRVEVALVLNSLLGGVSAALVYQLACTYHSAAEGAGIAARRFGWCVAGLAIVYPDSWMYSGLTTSENLLVPLLLGMVLVHSRRARVGDVAGRAAFSIGLIIGALAALAALVKANMLIYCLLLPIEWMVSGRRWLLLTLGAVVAGVLLLVPWTVLNYRASGGHIIPFAAIAGTVFLDGTNPEARGKPTDLYRLDIEKDGKYSEIELNRLRFQKGLAYVKENPAAYGRLLALKLLHGLSPARDYAYEYGGQFRLFIPWLSRWLPTAYNAFLLAGILVFLVLGNRQSGIWRNGFSLFASALLLQMIFMAYPRYRFPFLFVLIPNSVLGWWLIGTRFRRTLSRFASFLTAR